MHIDGPVSELSEVCDTLDQAIGRVSSFWDDRLSARINADCINDMTDQAQTAMSNLERHCRRAVWLMDEIERMSY